MLEYLYFDFGTEWMKKDLEGKVNLCREIEADWDKISGELYKKYGKHLPLNYPERGHISYLIHDGNRDNGLLSSLIDKYDREEVTENFSKEMNKFVDSLWISYAKMIEWARHAQIYMKMKELESGHEKD